MALIWSHREGERVYEVRSAGRTRRLYTNGVFHSQYNPASPVTGNVWDLLFLPAMFAPPGAIKRALVLGVGGGAVINQLDHFLELEEIVGVELDPIHIQVAYEHFGVRRERATLIEADAEAWVRGYEGPPFDLIIDDLFSDEGGEALRPVAADAAWLEALWGHLDARGVLVLNLGDADDWASCGLFDDPSFIERFAGSFQLTTRLYDNLIVSLHRSTAEISDFKRRLSGLSELDQERARCRLSFEIKELSLDNIKQRGDA